MTVALALLVLLCGAAPAGADMKAQLTSREMLDKARTDDKLPVDIRQRGAKIVVQTEDKPIEVKNSKAVSPYVQGLPVEAKIDVLSQSQVELKDVSLEVTGKWQRAHDREKTGFDRINRAYERLDAVAERALAPQADEDDIKALQRAVGAANTAVVETYESLSESDEEGRREVLETFRDIRKTGKAIYGLHRDDRYVPQTYQRIYENSRGAIALGPTDQKPHCSGVLIGKDLVLTNHHCIETFFPTDLQVRFEYEEDLKGNSLVQLRLPVTGYAVSSADQRGGLDFAVLQLGADANGVHAGDTHPPQCLTTKRVRIDDPLYVIGHPLQQPRTVHDNAFVFFPFQVTRTELTELELLVRTEFADAEDEDERVREFQESYRERQQGTETLYENYSKRYRQQPTIGADCDTFHGNSGSPVYSRRTHRVIGLLFDGEEDVDDEHGAGWRSHEAILPMSQIVAKLDEKLPDWRAQAGVCAVD